MFQKQLKALRNAITLASHQGDLVEAEKALTAIIKEKLVTPHRTTNVPAIYFLKNDETGNVYYRRSYVYENLGKRAYKRKDYTTAVDYLEKSIYDTLNAIRFYEDIYKKNKCRQEIREDEELIETIKQEQAAQSLKLRLNVDPITLTSTDSEEETPVALPKKTRSASKRSIPTESRSSHTPTEGSAYSLRTARMWNPKKQYENMMDRLDTEQRESKNGNKRSKFSY